MSPTIHFIRHAQGFHNLPGNYGMHDPVLTPLGLQQCTDLARNFPYTSSIDLIVASPLKRTIYTALNSFPSKSQMTIIALPELQETSDLPCDTGSSKEELQKEFDGKNINLELATAGWNSKKGRWAPARAATEERCREARNWLRAQKVDDIAVVTHGGVLHFLTEDWTGHDKYEGTGWANTEYRSYTFKPESGDIASLVETEESRTRRCGAEKPLDEAEQRNLKATALQEWQNIGQVNPPAHKASVVSKV